MLIVGLTGGIASGKSTVSSLLQSSGLPLVDLDSLAREVVRPGEPTLRSLVSHFGSSILLPDGTLDRPALGRIAFSSESERKVLNSITHGAIRKRMAWKLFKYWIAGRKVVVVDTPLLVEAGLWKFCGELVLVWCSPEDQLSRMLTRDSSKGLTPTDARSRLAAQLPLSQKLPYADVVLDNSSAAEGVSSSSTSANASPHHLISLSLRTQVHTLTSRWDSHYRFPRPGYFIYLLSWLVPPFGVLLGLGHVLLRVWSTKWKVKIAERSDRDAEERREKKVE